MRESLTPRQASECGGRRAINERQATPHELMPSNVMFEQMSSPVWPTEGGVACLSRVNDGASGISLGKYVISTGRGRGGGPELETRSGGMGNRGTVRRERGPGTDHLPLAHNLLVYGRSVPCRVDLWVISTDWLVR